MRSVRERPRINQTGGLRRRGIRVHAHCAEVDADVALEVGSRRVRQLFAAPWERGEVPRDARVGVGLGRALDAHALHAELVAPPHAAQRWISGELDPGGGGGGGGGSGAGASATRSATWSASRSHSSPGSFT